MGIIPRPLGRSERIPIKYSAALRRRCLFMLAGILLAIIFSCKKENVVLQPPTTDRYFSKVKLIIQNHCTISCHDPSHRFYQGMPVILETESDLVQRAPGIKASIADPITLTNKRMPSGSVLSFSDIDAIVKWNAKGGKTTD